MSDEQDHQKKNIQPTSPIPVAPTPAGMSGPGLTEPMPQHFGFSHQFALVQGQATDQFVAKMNDQHIADVIAADKEDNRLSHWREIARYGLFILTILIALGFIVLFCYLFSEKNPQLVDKVVYAVLGFMAGMGTGGFGVKVFQKKGE